MTDKELEKIYNEAYRAVYWTAMSLLKNEADAEDIVQDTFVTLIESYDTLNDKDKVIPWLKKIAANKCLNRLTRSKTDTVEDEFFDDVEAIAEDFLPDSIVESEEARKIIMDIINNKLSDDIRRTLILFYFDDLSTKEIVKIPLNYETVCHIFYNDYENYSDYDGFIDYEAEYARRYLNKKQIIM